MSRNSLQLVIHLFCKLWLFMTFGPFQEANSILESGDLTLWPSKRICQREKESRTFWTMPVSLLYSIPKCREVGQKPSTILSYGQGPEAVSMPEPGTWWMNNQWWFLERSPHPLVPQSGTHSPGGNWPLPTPHSPALPSPSPCQTNKQKNIRI